MLLCRSRSSVASQRVAAASRSAPRRSLNYRAVDSTISTKAAGKEGTKDWKLYFYKEQDMPVSERRKDIVNMVVEIPKGSDTKLEISKEEKHNPIKQDVKNGELRFLKHGKLPWNYGAFPQTWERPSLHVMGVTEKGDDDPLDVVEIGDQTYNTGDVVKVKVLGAFCLIDEGEADWKVVTINVEDPRAHLLHDVRDVEIRMPNVLSDIREWYRVYKQAEGKAANTYAFDGQCLQKEHAVEVLGSTHFAWLRYTYMRPEVVPRLAGV